ncbi:SRPBCC family protein [Streptomyces radicis]|uniref:SRPBCC family protein n=1 Tax=Streptomyces radicis TaxID=1750517 RepID=A0A3A9W9J8_9ACTN|nr:SRPBCC family protein [Streptomyces radicis]RKN09369.1 SRPBCC family protein [Streptomyces radicis]RKN23033.1 SRPBCC family protein [Streptomyces radicis]
MSEETQEKTGKGGSNGQAKAQDGIGQSLERLRHELTGFLGAQVKQLADKAGERITGLTERLGEAEKGPLPQVGKRLMGGESPAKAMTAEGAKDVKGKTVDKVKGAMGGGGGGGGDEGDGGGGKSGDTKVTSVIETIDVGVPLTEAYNHWTTFEGFGDFMKGVQSVERDDENPAESSWKLKIGPSNRDWKATVRTQIPDERIEWTSEGSKGSTRGVVTFHELAPKLTRIVLVLEYYPEGFFEKTANLWRAQGRRTRLDLKHFQRQVTLAADEVPEGWRGEIRDGEVVRDHGESEPRDQGGDEDDDENDEDENESEDNDDDDGEDNEGDDEDDDEEQR